MDTAHLTPEPDERTGSATPDDATNVQVRRVARASSPASVALRERLRLAIGDRDHREVARAAGLRSEPHVGMILCGDVGWPSAVVLGVIVKACGVSAGWLTYGEGAGPVDVARPGLQLLRDLLDIADLSVGPEAIEDARALLDALDGGRGRVS